MKRLGIDMQTVFGMPPVDHVRLASELGCGHISTGLAPVPWKLERFSMWSLHDPDTRREMIVAMRDLGITLSAVEGFAIRAQAHVGDRVADLDLAAELGAERVSSVCMETDLARGLDQLAMLAELAGQRGLSLTLEFAPPHAINTLAGALAAVRAVGSPNIRLVIDAMHFFRSGGTIADLGAVEPMLIGYVQLCDVPRASDDGNYYNEACFNRKCPGEGDLPLSALVRALPHDVPIGIETPMLSEIQSGDVRDVVRRIVKSSRWRRPRHGALRSRPCCGGRPSRTGADRTEGRNGDAWARLSSCCSHGLHPGSTPRSHIDRPHGNPSSFDVYIARYIYFIALLIIDIAMFMMSYANMSEKAAEKRVGRPSVDSEAVNVRCARDLLEALDAWRLSRPSECSRPKAARHLMRQALATLGYSFEGSEEMTSAERELLLLLAHEVARDIARDLREAGLKENEGVGGASIRKIISLTETIRAEASPD